MLICSRNAATVRTAAFTGLIVLGGPMNVDQTEKYPFLDAEIGWIRQALADQTPVLGICLGSQLLAKAAGGRFTPMPSKRSAGIRSN